MQNKLKIKKAGKDDLSALLELYTYLNDDPPQEITARVKKIYLSVLNDKNNNILLGHIGDKLVSSCTIIIIKNLTRNQRPYALIENVVTHAEYRNRGFASALLGRACEIAKKNNCYKIMLLTGSKKEGTLRFYENCGFNRADKTGFVKWL